MTNKIDYAKIIIIGIVLFVMIWGLLFICGVALNLNENTVIYGSMIISCIVSSIYFSISLKFSKKVGADYNCQISNKDRRLNNWEIYFAIIIVIYFITSYSIYVLYSKDIGKVMMVSAVLFKLCESYIKKKVSGNK